MRYIIFALISRYFLNIIKKIEYLKSNAKLTQKLC